MQHSFCIHFSVDRHLGSFQLLAIINKDGMNRVETVSLLHIGASSGYMSRSGISGSSGSVISNFLRNCQTDFQIGCTRLQCHQQWRSVPFLHNLSSICCHLSLDIICSDWCEMVLLVYFDFHFPYG